MALYRTLPTLLLAGSLAACGALKEKTDAVVVTAVPKDVERCRKVGPVATTSPEIDKDDGLNQLRASAVTHGGNTVLVMSYANSTDGIAYSCEPPLKTDSRSDKPG